MSDDLAQSTDDLSFAVYCLCRKIPVESMREEKRGGRAREYHFVFRCSEEDWNQLSIDFLNSPEAAFDLKMKAVKKSFNQRKPNR